MFFLKNNKFDFKITTVGAFLVPVVVFFIPLISSAQILVPQVNDLTTASLETVVGSVIQIFLGLLGLIALVIILYGGYVWMTSGGNEEKVSQAKKILSAGVVGLVIIMVSYVITSFILESVQDSANNSGSGGSSNSGFGSGFGGGALGGGIVEYHYPERDAINIPRNTMMMITLKTEVDVNSVIDGGFGDDTCVPYEVNGSLCGKLSNKIALTDDLNPRDNEMIIAVLTSDAKRILIKPINALGNENYNTYTSVNLASDMQSTDGQDLFPGLSGGYTWQFEISTFLDLTPPEVTFVWPSQDEEVDRNAIIQMNFSEPINILSVDGNINFQENSDVLTGELKISNQYRTVEFLSDGDCGGVNINPCGEQVFCLPALSTIDGIVSNISDASGNVMADQYDWSFSTSNEVNTTPPKIISVNPSTVNIQRNPDPQIRATFDKVISPSSVHTDNFYIYNNSICFEEIYNGEDGKSLISNDCFPDYSVYVDENNYRCNIRLYAPHLDTLSNYRPRLTFQIKDSYGNCFNEAWGPGGRGQQ
jgi:Type IV secretion system pilin